MGDEYLRYVTHGYPEGTTFDTKAFFAGKTGVAITIPPKATIHKIKKQIPRKTRKIAA